MARTHKQSTPRKPRKHRTKVIVVAGTLPPEGFWREPQVVSFFATSRSTLWRWIKDGHFPRPVKQVGITAWDCADLRAHVAKIRSGGAV